jgi:hypothetical protein
MTICLISIVSYPFVALGQEPIVVNDFILSTLLNNSNPRQDLNDLRTTTTAASAYVFNTKLPNMKVLVPNNNSNSSACAVNAAQDEQDRYLNRVTLILLIVLFCFYVVSLALSMFVCYLLYKRNRHFY